MNDPSWWTTFSAAAIGGMEKEVSPSLVMYQIVPDNISNLCTYQVLTHLAKGEHSPEYVKERGDRMGRRAGKIATKLVAYKKMDLQMEETKHGVDVTLTMYGLPKPTIRLGVVGGRDVEDPAWVWEQIETWIEELGEDRIETIISGGATGVDTAAADWARAHGLEPVVHRPKKRNRKEFLARNTLIVQDCTHLLALPSKQSRGTYDTIRKARNARKKIRILMYKK